MKKRHLEVCWSLFVANICSYVALFVLDVILFQVEKPKFTAVYGYLLFPIFSIVYGVVSYKKTKRVVLTNLLYFLFCFLFVILFTCVGAFFQDYRWVASPDIQRALDTMPIIGVCTSVSVIVSGVLSIVVSFITMWIYKIRRVNTGDGSVCSCSMGINYKEINSWLQKSKNG